MRQKSDKEIHAILDFKNNHGLSYKKLGLLLEIPTSTLHDLLCKNKFAQNLDFEGLLERFGEVKNNFKNNGKKGRGNIMEALTFECLEKFGLRQDPFRNEITSASDFYWNRELKKMEKEILEAIERKKFVALIGEVGSGKTMLMQMIRRDLKKRTKLIWVTNIHKRRLGPNHIIDAINMELSGTHKSLSGSMEARMKKVIDGIKMGRDDWFNYCVVIDDAHQLPEYTLRSLKQLYDLQFGFDRLMGIILLGQLEMMDIMMDARLRETAQRCAIYLMQGMSKPGQVEQYIKFKVEKVGGDVDKIFERKIFEAIRKNFSFEIHYGRRKYKICPFLRVQNYVAHLMNEAERLNEDKVSMGLMD